MPLPNILKKASSYILGDGNQDSHRLLYQDGEALFCKNNVCVHPPTLLRQHCDVVHHPGYMTLTCKLDKNTHVPTLHLSWIPNTTLRKHPTTLENLTPKKAQLCNNPHDKIPEEANGGRYENEDERLDVCLEVKEPINCSDCERVCSGGKSRKPCNDTGATAELSEKQETADTEKSQVDNPTLKIDSEKNVKSNESNRENDDKLRNNRVHRLRSDSLDSRVFENGSYADRRNVDDGESKNSLRDDGSVKSRSMSLTSTCSLSIAGSTDGNHCK